MKTILKAAAGISALGMTVLGMTVLGIKSLWNKHRRRNIRI